jgi:hypothetical protein
VNHAITIGDTVLALGILAGVAMIGLGALMAFAAGMSDAPAEGERVGRQGCTVAAIGLVVLIASSAALVLS